LKGITAKSEGIAVSTDH